MDIATLGLAIDSRQAVSAKDALDKLAPAAKRAESSYGALERAAQSVGVPMASTATAAARAATSAARLPDAINPATQAVKLNSFQMQNLTYQINDLAQVLATGQSPFRSIIQQGSQMVQIFGPGVGVRGALSAIGPAITQFMLNPLTLATVGFAAVAQGAYFLFDAISSGGAQSNQALEQHEDLMRRIREQYRGALPEAQDFYKTGPEALKFETNEQLRKTQEAYASAIEQLRETFVTGINSRFGVTSTLTGNIALPQSIRGALQQTEVEIDKVVESASKLANDPSLREWSRDAIRDFNEAAAAALQLQGQIAELTAGQSAQTQTGEILPMTDALRSRFKTAFALNPLEMALAEKGAFENLVQKLNGGEDPGKRTLSAIDQVLENLAFEADQLGRTNREQAIYNQLKAAGVTETSAYGQRIAEAAGRLYDMQEAQDRVNERLRTAEGHARTFLSTFTSGIRSGESVLNSFSGALERVANQLSEILTNRLASGLLGGLSFGGGVSPLVGLAHTGIGPGDPFSSFRAVAPSAFNNAQRFHSGIGPGERPAIIRDDESVLTPGQMRTLGGRSAAPVININVNSESGVRTEVQQNGSDIEISSYLDSAMAKNAAKNGSRFGRAMQAQGARTPLTSG